MCAVGVRVPSPAVTEPALEVVDPARWDDVLRGLGIADVYCSRGFVRASGELSGATPQLLHLAGADGDVVFAVLVREDPCDVVSPYGYGGPIGVGAGPPLAEFAAAYQAWCADAGVLTSFVVFHPLFGNDAAAGTLGFHRVPLGGTVAWSLTEPDPRGRMHKHHRRLVRRADAAGLVATVAPAPDSLDEFVTVYEHAMRRLDASDFYLFPPSYWAALLRDVPLVRVDVRDAEGELVAGVLGMGERPWLHYHLGAATDAARGTGASHLALCTLAEWGREQGYEVLHLGGGVSGRDDSLLEYKLRFAPDGLVASATGRAVHDRDAYARLTGADTIDWAGFFPAYRQSY
jgi:serine/alanine adding enzyme